MHFWQHVFFPWLWHDDWMSWQPFQSSIGNRKAHFMTSKSIMHSVYLYLSISLSLLPVCGWSASIQCLVILSLFGLCGYESVQLCAVHCVLWQVCQTGVPLFPFSIFLVRLLVLLFRRPLLPQHGAAVVYAHACAPRVFGDVPPQLAVLVASGQLGERSEPQVAEVLLRRRRRLAGLVVVRLAGPLQPQVVQLAVNALLWGGLEAAGVEAGEHGSLLWREHVQGVSPLLQAELPALHAADGGGPLELVVDLDAQSAPRLAELGSYVCLPFSRVSLKLPNLCQQGIRERIRREYVPPSAAARHHLFAKDW